MVRTADRRADGFRRTRVLAMAIAAVAVMLVAMPAPSHAQVQGTALSAHPGVGPFALWESIAAPGTSSLARIRSDQAWNPFSRVGVRAASGAGYVPLDGSPGFPPVADPRTDT